MDFAAGRPNSLAPLVSRLLQLGCRKGGRAVEGSGLENRQRGDSFVGSNPTLSANRFPLNTILPAIGYTRVTAK